LLIDFKEGTEAETNAMRKEKQNARKEGFVQKDKDGFNERDFMIGAKR